MDAKDLLSVTTQSGCEPALASGRTNHPTVVDAVQAGGSSGDKKRDVMACESLPWAFDPVALQAMFQGSTQDFVSDASVS